MDIRAIIMRILDKQGLVKTAEIVKATGFSRAYVSRVFQELRDEGKIILLGRANQARYVSATQTAVLQAKQKIFKVHRILTNKNLLEHEILDDIKNAGVVFQSMPENIGHIIDYAFTEMLNNAIEHSRSEKIEVTMERSTQQVHFVVIDKGVGIFNNIMQTKGLQSTLEAIQDLLKGKQTTAPENHSGEGIFFTSKAADVLTIQSGSKKIIFNTILHDIFIKDMKQVTGTKVAFSIGLDSSRELDDVFKAYTDDAFSFSKTEVTVRLYKMGREYVSRSQARRIVSGLDKFKKIILDFKQVETIGQGFADEIFRVWKLHYPAISVEAVNENENIRFMITRALAAEKSM